MGDYIKASELDASHIGKTVRVLFDKAEAEDVMQAVKHGGRLVTEGRIFERPFTRVAGIETTITFSKLGEVDCEPGQSVRVVD